MTSRPIPTLVLGIAGAFLCGIAGGFLLAPQVGMPRPEPAGPSRPAAEGVAARQREERSLAAAERGRAASFGEDGNVTAAMLEAVRSHDYFRRRHDLYELGERLSPAELASAMSAAEAFPGPDRDLAEAPLLSAWLRKDADGAMAWVRALPAGSHRHYMLSEAFSGLGRMDAQSALRFFADGAGFQSKSERSRCLHEIFHGWGESDPAAAAPAVAALPSAEDRETAVEPLIGHWVVRDPRAALAWASQRASAQERADGRSTVLNEWAQVDPAAASQYAISLPEGRERREAIRKVFRAVGEWDMDAALRLADGVASPVERSNLLGDLLSSQFGTPEQQVRMLESIPATLRESHHYGMVAQRFAEKDRAAALEWATNVPGVEAREYAVQGVLRKWAEEEPRSAIDYAMKNFAGKLDLVSDVFTNWADRDPQAALVWATALPEGSLRTHSTITAIDNIASRNPREALEVAGRTLHTAEDQQNAFSVIAGTWAQNDLPAVVEWMKRQPEKIQDKVIRTVTGEWSRQDPAGAAAWLDQLPKGARRDEAVGTFAGKIEKMDPEGAATWAATISDPDQRSAVFRNVIYNWSARDKAAAYAWLRSSNALSPQEHAELLRQFEERQ